MNKKGADKVEKPKVVIKTDKKHYSMMLTNASLLVMDSKTGNSEFIHRIKPEPKQDLGKRFNITFRN